MKKTRKTGKVRRIKMSRADNVFSWWIRSRDKWTCQYCGKKFIPPTRKLHASHYHTRGAKSVRFDPLNVESFCQGCHFFLETRKNAEYYDWKLKQLGTRRLNTLKKKYYTLKPGGYSQDELKKLIKKYETKEYNSYKLRSMPRTNKGT